MNQVETPSSAGVAGADASPPMRGMEPLKARIEKIRRKHLLVTVTEVAAAILAGIVAILWVEMFLDWGFEMPWAVRLLTLLGALGAAGYAGWKYLYLPLKRAPNDDGIALMVERAMPIFQTRFIASVQLARADTKGSSAALSRALIAETAAMAAPLNFKWVVKTERLIHTAKIAGGILAGAAALYWLAGPLAPLLLKRALLSTAAVPRKTWIDEVTGSRKIAIGDDLLIQATAHGIVPKFGWLKMTTASGKTREFKLEREAENDSRFSARLQSLQEPFTYTVRLNDATTEPFKVETLLRPSVTEISCHQVFPPYTNLKDRPLRVSDLSLLAGSHLFVEIKASAPLRAGQIHLEGTERETAMTVNPAHPNEIGGEILIPGKDVTGFSVRLVDQNGIESKNTAVYRIDLVPDKAPTVRITYPQHKEELITPSGLVLVGFVANDDFGVAKAVLRYVVGEHAEGEKAAATKSIEFDLGRQPLATLSRRFEWKIRALDPPPAEGSVIEFWVEVTDANTVTGPGVGTSDHYQIKIVGAAEKLSDLANRANDVMEGLSEVSATQEQLNQKLGTLIFEKPTL